MSDPLIMSPASVTISIPSGSIPPTLATNITARGFYSRFPAIWQPLSNDSGIEVVVTNNALTAPIAPVLVDAVTDPSSGTTIYSIFAELTTVQPGQTVDEIVQGIPVTQMYLVLWPLGIATSELGTPFTVNVAASRV